MSEENHQNLIACPHCRRKVRLYHKSVVVSPFTATVSLVWQCGQGLRRNIIGASDTAVICRLISKFIRLRLIYLRIHVCSTREYRWELRLRAKLN